jgi:hypothetical protein
MTWRERIVAARAAGRFTDADQRFAASWMTCAVGEQRHAHPDVVVALQPDSWVFDPIDRELYTLGVRFPRAVLTHDVDAAERLLDQIEDRVLALKRGEA